MTQQDCFCYHPQSYCANQLCDSEHVVVGIYVGSMMSVPGKSCWPVDVSHMFCCSVCSYCLAFCVGVPSSLSLNIPLLQNDAMSHPSMDTIEDEAFGD